MKTSEILTAARALIDTPEKWWHGGTDYPFELDCPVTAIGRQPAFAYPAWEAFERSIDSNDIVRWNDAPERTHADVMAAFDKAIAAERAREAADG